MLGKIFAKPLELSIGELTLKLGSPAEFEFMMAGRSAVSSDKIAAMVRFSSSRLKQEARTIKDIERRFANILAQCIEGPGSVSRAMRRLDPLLFSQDQDWRDIMMALNNGDEDYAPYRRIALGKYMQYMSSKKTIIKYLYVEKKKRVPGKVPDVPQAEEAMMPDEAGSATDDEHKSMPFERIPKGEAIDIHLPADGELEVFLSKHKCRIVAGATLKFIDNRERSFTLNKGRSIIGRDSVSTVMLSPALRDVSRLHLLVENLDGHAIQLTDISSHGTFIETDWLRRQAG